MGALTVRVRRAGGADLPALTALRSRWAGGVEDGFDERFARWWERQRDSRVAFLAELVDPAGLPRPTGVSDSTGLVCPTGVADSTGVADPTEQPYPVHGRGVTPIGMMHLALFERMPRPGVPDTRWAYLANAFVLAEHRNRGVGAALLASVLAHARASGCVRVVLAPSERSVPFYRRHGFGPASMLLAQVLIPPS